VAPVNGAARGEEGGAAHGGDMRNTMQEPQPARSPPIAEPERNEHVPRPARERAAGGESSSPRRHEATIGDLARTVLDGRWTFAGVAGAVLAVAALYLLVTPPTFESSILIQVEGRSRPVTGFEELAALFQEDTPTEGEMRILGSHTLLDAVITELGLDADARPRTFPLFGSAIARTHASPRPAPAPFGLIRYGWGGEHIRVQRLTVSDALVDETLTLTALEDGRYRLATPDGAVLAEGEAGEVASGTDGERSIELLLSDLVARPGTEFTLVKRRRIDVIERLQRAIRISEQGRNTGLVEVALTGTDPARIAAILDAVAATYLRQTVERTSAKASKALGVLEAQLPTLNANLGKAERALNAFHRRNNTVNLSAEGQGMLDRIVEIDRAIAENEVQVSELTRRYTDRHPDIPVVAARTRRLEAQRAAMEARLRSLPDLELESTRLQRQLRVATELYLLVLNRAEELRIVTSGWIGNIRVLEQAAVPSRPSTPNRSAVLLMGLLLGLGAGVGAVLLREALGRGAKDPEEIEARTGLAVLAMIPHSRAQRRLARRRRKAGVPALAVADPADAAVEELRGLRTAVQFALRQARNNVITLSGLAPRAGKSFVSVNLAHLLAAADTRVVVVDADLRRGDLHRNLGVEGRPGLADVLSGSMGLEGALRPSGTRGLDVLPAGTLVANPSELLAGERLQHVLAELGRRYDVVVVDTPPVMSVSDSPLVGRHAGVNLLVLRAGEHPIDEISYVLRRLVQAGVAVRGAVLNDVRP
jgi:tyrosine-protein kinase Etk/Wzc